MLSRLFLTLFFLIFTLTYPEISFSSVSSSELPKVSKKKLSKKKSLKKKILKTKSKNKKNRKQETKKVTPLPLITSPALLSESQTLNSSTPEPQQSAVPQASEASGTLPSGNSISAPESYSNPENDTQESPLPAQLTLETPEPSVPQTLSESAVPEEGAIVSKISEPQEKVLPLDAEKLEPSMEEQSAASEEAQTQPQEQIPQESSSEEGSPVESIPQNLEVPVEEQPLNPEQTLQETPQESSSEEHGVALPAPDPEAPSEILNETTVPPVPSTTPQESLVPQAEKKEEVPQKILMLEDAMVGAYTQTPLLTAEYKIKASQEALSHAKRRGWAPETSASVGYTYDTFHRAVSSAKAGPVVGTSGNTQEYGHSGRTRGAFELKQNLYRGGATLADIKAHQKNLDATEAEYLATEKEILRNAIKAYIELITKQEVYRLTQANQKLLEQSFEVAKNRYEYGELTQYDVASTQSKLDKAKGDVITALAEVEMMKASFLKETGIDPIYILEKPAFPEKLMPASKEESIQLCLKHNPLLRIRDAQAEAAKADADKVVGGLLPSADLSAQASRTLSYSWDKDNNLGGGYGKNRMNDVTAAATLSIPLDFFGATQSNVRQYKYHAAQKRLEALNQRRDVMEKTSQAWDVLEATKAKITQVKSQMETAKIAVEMVREEFLAGNKTTLEVLTAEQDYFAAQVELVKAEQGRVQAAYELLNAIGILTAQNLALDVKIYNPEKDYEKISFWGINIDKDSRFEGQEVSNIKMQEGTKTI